MEKKTQGLGDLKIDRGDRSMRLRTIDFLRQAILDFRFKPGERLVEAELCKYTGVSRSCVREALRHLEGEGMVTNTPQVGQVVTSVTADEARWIYEVRASLDSLAIGTFAERASDAQIKMLSAVVALYPSALAEHDAQVHLVALDEFYSIVYSGCDNPVLIDLSRRLRARVRYIRTMASPHYGDKWRKQSVANYRRILRAVKKRDRAAAESAVRRQVADAMEIAFKVLSSQ